MGSLSRQEVKEVLGDILDQLPFTQQQQILDFARFLQQQVRKPSPLRTETAEEVSSPTQLHG